jgi:hypothetical protein
MSYSNSCSSLYRDVYNASDCYEFATVGEMNGVSGAVPIPASTAQRFFETNSTVNAQGQVQNPIAPEIQALANAAVASSSSPDQAAANLMAAANMAAHLRYNHRF